ncbi:MAG: hypothetical protein OXN17_10205 [Candidatus Poribacteria bacterium]|nr:hypothetical protein [Candidatus Poribacteria bacterium]MDE0505268.1 hypothetical protein [Candidatus Poribacteria bacterium]
MPFIHIKSLPFDKPRDVGDVLEGLTRDFAESTGVGLEHVTATWEFLPEGHYAVAGSAALHQPQASHPVLVDLVAPDFNSPENVETMLESVALCISKRAKVQKGNIFISYQGVGSRTVFDRGEVVRW